MTLRRALLALHRWIGLAAALFLFVLGATGGILALQPDYDGWLHPALRRVRVGASRLSEQELADRVTAEFTHGPETTITAISIGGPTSSTAFALQNDELIFVDPYTGTVLGTREHATTLDEFLAAVRKVHVRLVAGTLGQWLVDLATLTALFLLPTGLILWWRRKTATVSFRSTWPKIVFDLHSVTGAYGFVFVLLVAATGVFIAFEPALQFVTRSAPVLAPAMPHSVIPVGGNAARASLDELLAAADRVLPGERTAGVLLPVNARSAVRVLKTGPRGYGRSTAFLDQYSGAVLRVDDFASTDRAERTHVVNAALHTGAMFGLPGRLLMSLSSFSVALLAVTGVLQWWRRAAG